MADTTDPVPTSIPQALYLWLKGDGGRLIDKALMALVAGLIGLATLWINSKLNQHAVSIQQVQDAQETTHDKLDKIENGQKKQVEVLKKVDAALPTPDK